MTQGRDEQRFEAIFRAHYGRVASYALRRAAPDDAADVVAATFTTAWRRLGAVSEGDQTLPWLLATARRVLANERRRRARSSALVQRLTADLGRVVPDRVWPLDEDALVARRTFASLSAEDREVLSLVGWDGLGPSELATVLGITPNAARVRLHRARARFSSRLAGAGLACDLVDDRPVIGAPSVVAETKGGQDAD